MKITSKKTGLSFNLSGKGAADFFYAKVFNQDGRVKYLNKIDDYYIDIDDKDEISQTKFFFLCVGLILLFAGSILLYIHLNY